MEKNSKVHEDWESCLQSGGDRKAAWRRQNGGGTCAESGAPTLSLSLYNK